MSFSINANETGKTRTPLDLLPRPSWLVNASLHDQVWTIQSDDPKQRRGSAQTLSFDVPIAYGGIRLSDAERAGDLLTAKLYIYHALSGTTGWISGASAARRELLNLLIVLQWRIDRGLERNSQINETWYSEFKRSLRNKGLEGLLRSEVRVEGALAHFANVGAPLTPPSPGDSRRWLQIQSIIEFAGHSNHLQITPVARQMIIDFGLARGLTGGSLRMRRGEMKVAERSSERRAQTLARFFRVWLRLWDLRDVLGHDPIGYQAFPDRKTPARLGVALGGTPLGRTKNVPAEQACFLVDRALRWVLDYAPGLLALAEQYAEAREADNGKKEYDRNFRAMGVALDNASLSQQRGKPGTPWPLARSYYRPKANEGKLSLSDALFRLLPAACAIVIAALSARRKDEINSLRGNCIRKGTDGDIYLKTYILKGPRGTEEIPTGRAVACAVELLEKLSHRARQHSGDDWIFQFIHLHSIGADKPNAAGFQWQRDLNFFAEYVGVPRLPSGDAWLFAPHQFRRFFAVCYYYRYRHRSLTALSHFFRHSDPDMTRQYITNAAKGGFLRLADEQRRRVDSSNAAKSRQADLEDVSREFRTELFLAAATGELKMSGYGGAQVTAELETLVQSWRGGLEISESDDGGSPTLSDLIQAYAKGAALEPHPLGHSYCKCTSSKADVDAAGCVKVARKLGEGLAQTGPEKRHASDLVCSACPHNLQLPENEAYWRAMQDDAVQTASSTTGALRARATLRADAAREHLERCFPGVKT